MSGIIGAGFNVLVGIGIPLGVCLILLWRKNKEDIKIFWLGVGGFLVSQLILRQALLAGLQSFDWYRVFAALHAVAYMLFLAVTAAVFEESARYVIYRFFIHALINGKVPIIYGLGHGGLEACLIGLNNVLLLIMSSGYLMEVGWSVALAGFERLFVMLAQISFSILVYTGKRGWCLAIFLHTIYDFAIVLLQFGWSQLALEGLLMIMSLMIGTIALKVWRKGEWK